MWFSTVCLISAPRIIRQSRCLFHMQHMTGPKVLDFRVVQMWRRPMQLPAKKTPTVVTAPRPNCHGRSRLIRVGRPVACFYGCISRFSYMPSGPSRSAWHFHCRGLARDIPEHWNPAQSKGTPRWAAVSLSIEPWGCTSGSCTGRRHSHCKTDAFLTTTIRRRRIAPPRGWLCSLADAAGHIA